METFRKWLKTNKIKYYEAAKALGITNVYISKLFNGERRASVPLAIRIEKYTNGEVLRQFIRPDLYA
jgi:plasmid maintenance system antidote protein VapI